MTGVLGSWFFPRVASTLKKGADQIRANKATTTAKTVHERVDRGGSRGEG